MNSMPTELTRSRLNEYLTSHPEVPAARIADASGFSTGTISAFRSGEYKGDNDKVGLAIQIVLDTWDEETKYGYQLKTYETTTFRKIVATLDRSRRYKGITCIAGDNGTGKTHTAKAYCEHTNSILIEANPGYSPKALCIAVSKFLKLNEDWNINDMVARIVEHAPQKLLIIDEAENLPVNTLNMARRLHDQSELNLVLLGSRDLYTSLKSRKITHKYIIGRIDLYIELKLLNLPEINEIMDDFPYKSDAKVREMLVRYSGLNFRILTNLLRLINDFCQKTESGKITPNIVNNAKDHVLILN